MGNFKVHVVFSLFCSMVVLKPLLCSRWATYIFPCPLTLLLNLSLSFSCNTFHLCYLWYPVEDGRGVCVPRTITFLLFLLLQQLFILSLCTLWILPRKGSVSRSTALCMSVPTQNLHTFFPLLQHVVTFSMAARSALSDCRT